MEETLEQSVIPEMPHCISLGQNQYVSRLKKGIFSSDPPKPKYDVIWDPDLVLNYIKIMGENKKLSLRWKQEAFLTL